MAEKWEKGIDSIFLFTYGNIGGKLHSIERDVADTIISKIKSIINAKVIEELEKLKFAIDDGSKQVAFGQVAVLSVEWIVRYLDKRLIYLLKEGAKDELIPPVSIQIGTREYRKGEKGEVKR